MPETTIVTKQGMSHVWTAAFTAGGVAGGVYINQTYLLNKGTISTVGGAITTLVGAFAATHDGKAERAIGAALLGAGVTNFFLGLYDISQGNY